MPGPRIPCPIRIPPVRSLRAVASTPHARSRAQAWREQRIGFRCGQSLSDDIAHIGNQAHQGGSNGEKGVHRTSRGDGCAGLGQLAIGRAPGISFALPDQVAGFAAMRRYQGDQTSDSAPHSGCNASQRDDVDALIAEFSGVGDVLKDPWSRDLISGVPVPEIDPTSSPASNRFAAETSSAIGSVAISENVSVSGLNTVIASAGIPTPARFGRRAYSNRFASPCLWPVGFLSRISKSAAIRELAERSGADSRSSDPLFSPARDVDREGEGVAYAQGIRICRRRHAVGADATAECGGPG